MIFLAFIVLFLLAVSFGYYTRRGSGIDQRPSDGRGQAPGADGASAITTAGDSGEERTLSSHGTQ